VCDDHRRRVRSRSARLHDDTGAHHPDTSACDNRLSPREWLTGGAMARRTTHRSVAGRKLYAVRDSSGRFKDIQTYERAHRADLARTSKKEKAARARGASKKK